MSDELRPARNDELSGAPLEALREELNHLNKGIEELLTRRRQVTTAISIKIDDSRSHLMSSDEFFAKVTGQYESDTVSPQFSGPEDTVPERARRF